MKLGKLYTDEVLSIMAKEDLIDILPDEPIEFDAAMIAAANVSIPEHPEGESQKSSSVSYQKIKCTSEQYLVILEAVEHLRMDQQDESISEGRCIELICADYLAG